MRYSSTSHFSQVKVVVNSIMTQREIPTYQLTGSALICIQRSAASDFDFTGYIDTV